VDEVQAFLDGHLAGHKHTAQPILSESALLRAIVDVGYVPPNTPPDDQLRNEAQQDQPIGRLLASFDP
jgi:hypothetical protein